MIPMKRSSTLSWLAATESFASKTRCSIWFPRLLLRIGAWTSSSESMTAKESDMIRRPISRRAVLRGAGGVALPLPALEIMRGARRAQAAPPTKRFVVMWVNSTIGTQMNGPPPWDYVVPAATGPMNESMKTPVLAPFFDEGVQSDMILVSGLRLPLDANPDGS